MRPDCCLIDDIQSTSSASNPEQVEKLLDTIRKDIVPLAGKERISLLQTFTQICPDDLVEKIKNDKSWTTTIYPTIIRYPDNMKLWEEYLEKYENETAQETSHSDSLRYYKEHFEEMNAGSEVFDPRRFSEKDGHISAIQKWMQLRREIGEAAFDAEYQQNPKSVQYALPITPKLVASRVSEFGELELPDEGLQYVCAASDLNLSKYITTVIMAFTRNQQAYIVWYKFRKCKIPINIPEQDYYQRVYNLLGEHGKELKSLADSHGIRISGWSIDANGVPFKAVTDFARNSVRICGISAAGFVGKASHMFRSFLRSRLKEEVNRTLLCGDEDERRRPGTGRKYTYFDSDMYHEQAQKGFLQELGNIGSISWHKGGRESEWAMQICAEKLIMRKMRQDGTTEYTWKKIGPDHDALDAIGQCLATYASQGFSDGNTGRMSLAAPRRLIPRRKAKVRIV